MPPENANRQNNRPNRDEENKDEEKSEFVFDSSIILGLIIVGALFYSFIQKYGGFNFATSWQDAVNAIPEPVKYGLRQFVIGYVAFATILSIIFVVGVVYSLIRILQLEREWRKLIYPSPELQEEPRPRNEKWERVLRHIASDNPSDWRLAILEADIMLDELLDSLGYLGDTIGDKLKKANKGDFTTLDYAWEAHRIRNAIAHEGSDFIITQREARRIIGLYEAVFREFNYIDRKDSSSFSAPTRGETS
jgi:hypothetical protein